MVHFCGLCCIAVAPPRSHFLLCVLAAALMPMLVMHARDKAEIRLVIPTLSKAFFWLICRTERSGISAS